MDLELDIEKELKEFLNNEKNSNDNICFIYGRGYNSL